MANPREIIEQGLNRLTMQSPNLANIQRADYHTDPPWLTDPERFADQAEMLENYEPSDEEIALSESKKIKKNAYKQPNVYKNAKKSFQEMREYAYPKYENVRASYPEGDIGTFKAQKELLALKALYNDLDDTGYGPQNLRKNILFQGNETNDIADVSNPLDPQVKIDANRKINSGSRFNKFSQFANKISALARRGLRVVPALGAIGTAGSFFGMNDLYNGIKANGPSAGYAKWLGLGTYDPTRDPI